MLEILRFHSTALTAYLKHNWDLLIIGTCFPRIYNSTRVSPQAEMPPADAINHLRMVAWKLMLPLSAVSSSLKRKRHESARSFELPDFLARGRIDRLREVDEVSTLLWKVGKWITCDGTYLLTPD